MSKLKGLISLVFLLYLSFSILELKGLSDLSFIFECLIVPTITLFYLIFLKKKKLLFLFFLLCYALSDLLTLFVELITNGNSKLLYHIEYYAGNSLYILAYIFLIIKICKSLNFKYVFKHFKTDLLVLSIVNFFLLFITQIELEANVIVGFDYYIEVLYNSVIFILLSVAFLNYIYKDNKKSLYLLVGALFTFFSEIIALAHIYISSDNVLSVLSTTLSLAAFFFFCKQTRFLNISKKETSFVVIK